MLVVTVLKGRISSGLEGASAMKNNFKIFLLFLPQVSPLPEGLNIDRLQAILKGYGEYPAKYRSVKQSQMISEEFTWMSSMNN